MVGGSATLMVISSVELGQTPLEIVQRKVVDAPIVNPLTVDVAKAGTSAVPLPAIVDQAPVPTVGVFPAKAEVVILHKFWSEPAAAVVGDWSICSHIVSTEFGQTPLEIVQVSVSVLPDVNPVTPEVGLDGVVTVDEPKITAQVPIPITGVFPANVDVVTLQSVWSAPAAAVVGGSSTEMMTSSVDGTQEPLVIVQRKVAEVPITNPVTPEVGLDGVVTVTIPETTDQAPVPTAGVFPAKVAVVTLHKFWSGPAAAMVTASPLSITISSVEAGQTPLEIVHRKVSVVAATNPETAEVGEAGTSTVAVPKTTDQLPVPIVGVFPASIVVDAAHNNWSGPAVEIVGS